MDKQQPGLHALLKLLCRIFCGVAVAVGALVLVGWAIDNPLLKSVVPGLVAMNPTTAIAFILAGVALWMLRDEAVSEDRSTRRVAQVCAAIVLLIGLLKLIELMTHWPIGVDRLLFHDKLETLVNGRPNRMAPNTALNFFLLGSAILLLDWRALPSQIMALGGAAASLLALVGYAYGAQSFYGVGSFIPMALHTAFTFLLLLTGVLFARADRGLMAVPSSDSAGGSMARLLLPAAIGIPFILGWLRLAGQRAGLYDLDVGLALFVVMNMVAFGVLVWRNAVALYHADMARRRAAEALAQSHAELSRHNAEMEADLSLAREMQQAFLPQQALSFPRVVGPREGALRFHHRYYPASTLGGDFTDILILSETQAGVFICDVMGHGVRSALVTAVARGLVEELLPHASDPGRFMGELNRSLTGILGRSRTPMFASAFFMVADVASGQVRYANAGHPSPLHVRRRAGVIEELDCSDGEAGPALGVFANYDYVTSQCALDDNDLVMLFTDGLFEVEGKDGEYGEEQLAASVQRCMNLPASALFDSLFDEIHRFTGGQPFEDDVCVVGMEVAHLDKTN